MRSNKGPFAYSRYLGAFPQSGKRWHPLPGSQSLDYPKVIDKKNHHVINKHSKGVEFLLRKNKVDWIKGYARLKGGGRIEVEGVQGTQTLEARNIIIATGSEARMLPGLQPDAGPDSDQHRDPEPDRRCKVVAAKSSARAPWG